MIARHIEGRAMHGDNKVIEQLNGAVGLKPQLASLVGSPRWAH